MTDQDFAIDIRLTEQAAQQVLALMQDKGNYTLKLRVYITGGGCSGFQYGFKLEEAVQEDDFVTSNIAKDDAGNTHEIELLIDSASIMYMDGSTVDYKKDLKGAYFSIDNPNAVTTCGCGTSFAIE